MASYQRQSQQTILVVLAVLGVLAVGIVLVLALSGRSRQTGDRGAPQPVYNRVVQDLQRDDMEALHTEMSPSLQEIFPLEQLLAGEQSVAASQGR